MQLKYQLPKLSIILGGIWKLGQKRSQEYRKIYDDGKGPLLILTSLFSNGIQPLWTKDPIGTEDFLSCEHPE